jgi:galactose mutarotase-like enzyme
MQVSINSEILKAVIDSLGAELHSIKDYNETEYLWQANPKIWKRYSPVLFPFICNTKSKKYTYNGESYSLANHGFARDSEFELVFAKENTAEFLLKSNELTKKIYPFDFEFLVTYSITENCIKTSYTVINTDSKNMYFFIGGHPAFNCPILSTEKFEDYYVLYEKNETIVQKLDSGFVTIIDNSKKLPLTHELFKNDVIMKELPESSCISLKSKVTDNKITVSFDNNGCIAVWSPSRDDAEFVCLEPWSSVPVYCCEEEELTKMKYAKILEPNAKYKFSYSITIESL